MRLSKLYDLQFICHDCCYYVRNTNRIDGQILYAIKNDKVKFIPTNPLLKKAKICIKKKHNIKWAFIHRQVKQCRTAYMISKGKKKNLKTR